MDCVAAVSLADVRAAAQRISDFLVPTPVLYRPERRAWLKLENAQVTGAYKVRGALNALLAQLEREDRRSIVAASAGNHGAGVAWAARAVGLDALVVVPKGAPRSKIARIHESGGCVLEAGVDFEESLSIARAQAGVLGRRLLHAFDDPDIIAGQGTVALELLSLRPDVVLVPIGGGGLAAGVSLVLRAAGVRVVGVQIVGVDAMASWLRGGPARITPSSTIADGLRVHEPGMITRGLCRQTLEQIVLIREDEVRRAMRSLWEQEGLRIEGAGAVAVAGLGYVEGARRVALVTGGNVADGAHLSFSPVAARSVTVQKDSDVMRQEPKRATALWRGRALSLARGQ